MVGSCLLHRSSDSLQFKSSSVTLVLHTACSIKLYSSAAFVFCDHKIYRPALKGFRLSLVKTQSSRNTQLKSARSSLPDGENRFSNDALPPPEVKFTPQDLQLLLFFECLYLVLPLLQTFVGVADI